MQSLSIFLFYLLILVLMSSSVSAFKADGFVRVQGDQFVLSSDKNHIFKVKGFNYSPQNHPWRTWSEWALDEIKKELAFAGDLGCNTLRVALPFNDDPGPENIAKIKIFLDIASSNGMKVMFILFDNYKSDILEGSKEEAGYIRSINSICGQFKDDTRIFAWDIKNEPDMACGDGLWSWHLHGAQECAARRISWLKRMRDAIKAVDSNHLVTVGLVFPFNNYLPKDYPLHLVDFLDFVCYHFYTRNYPAETFRSVIQSLKQHTNKPINIQEIGHTTDNTADYTEAYQALNFRHWLKVVDEENITGIVQWALTDWHKAWPGGDEEMYYGFLRNDGYYSLKPAALYYKNAFPAEQFLFSDKSASISGRVVNKQSQPVSRGTIVCIPGYCSSKLSENGSFSIKNVPSGKYTLKLQSEIYKAGADNMQVEDKNIKINLIAEEKTFPKDVVNGDFKQKDLSGWYAYGQFNGVKETGWNSINAFEGDSFLGHASARGPMNGGVFQTVSVEPGCKYILSAYVLTRVKNGDGKAYARIGIDAFGFNDEVSQTIVWSPELRTFGLWKEISLEVTAASSRLTIFIEHIQRGNSSLFINCFDSVAVRKAF